MPGNLRPVLYGRYLLSAIVALGLCSRMLASNLTNGTISFGNLISIVSPTKGSGLEEFSTEFTAKLNLQGSVLAEFVGEFDPSTYELQEPIAGNQALYVANPANEKNSMRLTFSFATTSFEFNSSFVPIQPSVFLTDGISEDRITLAYGLSPTSGVSNAGSVILDFGVPGSFFNQDNLGDGVEEVLNIDAGFPTNERHLASSSLADSLGGELVLVGEVVEFDIAPVGVPGDYNNDGIVNAADYIVFRNNEGSVFDFPNRSPALLGQSIGEADYRFWVRSFDNSRSVAPAAVPAPSSLVLVLATACVSLAARRGTLFAYCPVRVPVVYMFSLSVIALPPTAEVAAESVTFRFRGAVTESEFLQFSISDTVTGLATFETVTVDSDPVPNVARYSAALTGYNVAFSGGYVATFDPAGTVTNIQIVDDSPVDIFSILADVTGSGVDGASLESSTMTVINDFAPSVLVTTPSLPTTAPNLSLADISVGALRFSGNRLVQYEITSLTDAAPPSPGDFDFDGDVDGGDFLRWQRGQLPDPVSTTDLEAWKANYGTSAPLSAISTAVPEPSSTILLTIGMMTIRFSRVSAV